MATTDDVFSLKDPLPGVAFIIRVILVATYAIILSLLGRITNVKSYLKQCQLDELVTFNK